MFYLFLDKIEWNFITEHSFWFLARKFIFMYLGPCLHLVLRCISGRC